VPRGAAECGIVKNPIKAYRDIIRVWGVFADYKPKRRRRWSKALVRHGADPEIALAAVLGVPAEEIEARGIPDSSEPPVTASTVPNPRPNSPNPNPNPNPAGTRLAPAVPGSPAGGR
jgi:hypothetical protein